jgi:hypothetical protein
MATEEEPRIGTNGDKTSEDIVAAGETLNEETDNGDRGVNYDHFVATRADVTENESGSVVVYQGGLWRIPGHAKPGFGERSGYKSFFSLYGYRRVPMQVDFWRCIAKKIYAAHLPASFQQQ